MPEVMVVEAAGALGRSQGGPRRGLGDGDGVAAYRKVGGSERPDAEGPAAHRYEEWPARDLRAFRADVARRDHRIGLSQSVHRKGERTAYGAGAYRGGGVLGGGVRYPGLPTRR